jgi:hypothetical protein
MERKEHKEKRLCRFFFAVFAFYCGQFLFGYGFGALGHLWLKCLFQVGRLVLGQECSVPFAPSCSQPILHETVSI